MDSRDERFIGASRKIPESGGYRALGVCPVQETAWGRDREGEREAVSEQKSTKTPASRQAPPEDIWRWLSDHRRRSSRWYALKSSKSLCISTFSVTQRMPDFSQSDRAVTKTVKHLLGILKLFSFSFFKLRWNTGIWSNLRAPELYQSLG